MELQRKMCSVLIEKDALSKDLSEFHKKHDSEMRKQDEYQTKLRQQIEELRKALETVQAQKQQIVVDANLQSQLTSLLDEKQTFLTEIQNLKNDLNKLMKERVKYKEEHKDNKQLKQVINKHLSEIEKLNQIVKELQETNEFLGKQIENLNQQIFELNNSKCENEENRVVEDGFEVLDPKRTVPPVNKRVFELAGSSLLGFGSPKTNNKKSTTLSNVDLNNMGNDSAGSSNNNTFNTPVKQSTANAAVATPSSSVRKQNQCAQQ
jgi:hypothetical protein